MTEFGNKDNLRADVQPIGANLPANIDVETNNEVEKFVKAIKGWGVNGVFPKGLTITGPFPGAVKADEHFSMVDERMIPDVRGGIMDSARAPEVSDARKFMGRLGNDGYRHISEDGDFASNIRDLLSNGYAFIFTPSSGEISNKEGIASFLFFQKETESDHRYQCTPLQVNFRFDQALLQDFSSFLKSKPENAEIFLGMVVPDIDKKVNRYKHQKLYIIDSKLPDSLKGYSLLIYGSDVQNFRKLLSESATLVNYETPAGNVDIPPQKQK